MKSFHVSIQINVELDDDGGLGEVISALSYVPSIAGGTATLTGITVHENLISEASALGPLVPQGRISAASPGSSEDSTPADDDAKGEG